MAHCTSVGTHTISTLPAKTRGLSNLLSPSEASAILGVTVGTLAVWRSTKRVDIPFVKIGRSVKYRPEDLQEHISRQSVSAHE